MSSVGIAVTSKDFWKGKDPIEKKLGSVLDRKVMSSTKQVLLDRIEFRGASKPDPFYQELKAKYTPINSTCVNQRTAIYQGQNSKEKTHSQSNGIKIGKDELPAPKFFLFKKDKVHLQWKTVRTVGPGLFNLGNTCFLNSVIQVLTYTPPLVNYLATQEHSKTCATVGFCMLCELQRHVLRTFSHGPNEAIKPLAILQKLKYIAKHLRFGQQEDSHEFLRYVIDGMTKSCLAGSSAKLDIYTKATTMVHQVFGGYFRSQVTCEKCHHTSNTYDPLMELLLDIKHAHSMLNALHKLISVESLNGDNMYLCPKCKRKVPAKKSLRIHEPPNIMTMCLKRFDSHSLFASKINKEISYPEQFNLRPFMSTNQGPAVHYKLYAVLVHSGYSCNSGHYYCFIKAANNQWYQMNDSSVRQVSLKTVLAQQAYLLFYIREHHTQKEKSSATQQPVRNTWTNGTKAGGYNQPQKQHLPKVISEPTKKANKSAAQQFPKRPETSRPNAVNNPRPTSISLQREKITFALGQGKQVKKSNDSQKDKHKDSETNVGKEETQSFHKRKEESRTTVEHKKVVDEQLQVDEISSSVKEVNEEEQVSADKKHHEETVKGGKTTQELHATAKWTVTPKNGKSLTGLHPSSLKPGDRERTPSMSSEISNTGSLASKTGDWSVSDRNASVEMGPRIPERQHAGWTVSTPEAPKKDKKTERVKESKQTTEEIGQAESHKKHKKRKHSKDKRERKKEKVSEDEAKLLSDECREESDDERKREKTKRLKKLKKAKERKSKENSSDEDERKKKHKKKKHKRKRERKGSETADSGADFNSSRERLLPSESERNSTSLEKKSSRTKENKKDKKHLDSDKINSEETRQGNRDSSFSADINKHRRKEQTSQSSENTENDGNQQNRSSKSDERCEKSNEEDQFHTKSMSKVDITAKNIVAKGKELVGKISESQKKDKGATKKLVQYSDDSSEEQDEDSRGESRKPEDTSRDNRGERNTEKRVNSHDNRGELRTNGGTSKDNRGENNEEKKIKSSSSHNGEKKDRKHVVDALMGSSRKSTNYGRLVERWDGKEDKEREDAEESSKRRRDIWDEEYDTGKVKRAKSKEKIHHHSYHGENSFQREYDRRIRNNGWHSSSSSGWHKRSTDRHSRRERR